MKKAVLFSILMLMFTSLFAERYYSYWVNSFVTYYLDEFERCETKEVYDETLPFFLELIEDTLIPSDIKSAVKQISGKYEFETYDIATISVSVSGYDDWYYAVIYKNDKEITYKIGFLAKEQDVSALYKWATDDNKYTEEDLNEAFENLIELFSDKE